jgi:hypothetical protein
VFWYITLGIIACDAPADCPDVVIEQDSAPADCPALKVDCPDLTCPDLTCPDVSAASGRAVVEVFQNPEVSDSYCYQYDDYSDCCPDGFGFVGWKYTAINSTFIVPHAVCLEDE